MGSRESSLFHVFSLDFTLGYFLLVIVELNSLKHNNTQALTGPTTWRTEDNIGVKDGEGRVKG